MNKFVWEQSDLVAAPDGRPLPFRPELHAELSAAGYVYQRVSPDNGFAGSPAYEVYFDPADVKDVIYVDSFGQRRNRRPVGFTHQWSIDADADHRSGIYEWRISDVGVYVGKATTLKVRVGEYWSKNVCRMLEGRPYHIRGRDYRRVHKELRRAYDERRHQDVTLSVLEHCAKVKLDEREDFWLNLRRCEAAVGGLPILNDT